MNSVLSILVAAAIIAALITLRIVVSECAIRQRFRAGHAESNCDAQSCVASCNGEALAASQLSCGDSNRNERSNSDAS